MKKGTIELIGMNFRAFHGCFEEERRDGNSYVVDFRADLDTSRAQVTDSLEDTVDYGRIYQIVKEQMAIPSNLLENVAGRIAGAVCAEFPGLEGIEVSVSKKNPPVGGEAQWSKITVRK